MEKQMSEQQKRLILEARFASPKVTDASIEDMKASSSLYRGHVKTSRGDVYRAGEFEKRSDAVLSVKLP